MPVNITIRSVPDQVAARLRQRALGNRRSLQQELLSLLEASATASQADDTARISEPAPAPYRPAPTATRKGKAAARAPQAGERLGIEQLWQRAQRLGPPSVQESTALIRSDRDARHRR